MANIPFIMEFELRIRREYMFVAEPITSRGYVLCSVCEAHVTKKASGICSRCERNSPVDWKRCKVCGVRRTKDPTAICSYCRKSRSRLKKDSNNDQCDIQDRLDQAMLTAQLSLYLLTYRKEGMSFSEIGKKLGISKGCYGKTKRKQNHKNQRYKLFHLFIPF